MFDLILLKSPRKILFFLFFSSFRLSNPGEPSKDIRKTGKETLDFCVENYKHGYLFIQEIEFKV